MGISSSNKYARGLIRQLKPEMIVVLLIRFKDLMRRGIMVVSLFALNCIFSCFSYRIHQKISAPQNLKDRQEMDRGRYAPHHGWENNSVIAAFPLLTTKDAEDSRSIGHVIDIRVTSVML